MPKQSIVLTEEQRRQLRSDMDEHVDMLSAQEVEHLAGLMHRKIDIPFLPAGREHTIMCKLVRKVDRYLYEVLPNELYAMVKSPREGLTVAEAEELHEIIVTRATARFQIRYLPESVEQQIFHFLVGQLLRAMRKDMSVMKL